MLSDRRRVTRLLFPTDGTVPRTSKRRVSLFVLEFLGKSQLSFGFWFRLGIWYSDVLMTLRNRYGRQPKQVRRKR